ncbi:MAG TPA: DUF3667 domain-containing protein [Chitinophagaceae bacterium]
MSHIPQRKEKDCLNCGTIVQGHYCHVCGQENVVPKETFWHMVTHFLYDITHFDSKFFATLKDLIFKPGFLTREYMAGRRAKYLHPVKMYVFTSAIFFLLFFGFFAGDTFKINNSKLVSGKARLIAIEEIEADLLKDTIQAKADSANFIRRLHKLEQMKDTTVPVTIADFAEFDDDSSLLNISGFADKYKSVEQYDSIQKQLPDSLRDSWSLRRLIKKELSVNKRYGKNKEAAFEKLIQTVLHRLPYMLFVSLPLFALILKLLYIRRKNFFYADHGVFTIHLYIFSFILLLVVFSLNRLREYTGWGILGWVIGLLFILLNIYLYKAMRRFYGQRRFKTIVKFLLTAALSLLMMLILFVLFFFFSAIEL